MSPTCMSQVSSETFDSFVQTSATVTARSRARNKVMGIHEMEKNEQVTTPLQRLEFDAETA